MNQTHVKKKSNPCEKKKSIVIKRIMPSTRATDQTDLPTANQPMIHLLVIQQIHQLRSQNSETKTI